MVSVSASVNLPVHHKVQKFSSGTGSPGWSQKKGHKTVVVWVMWCGGNSDILSVILLLQKTVTMWRQYGVKDNGWMWLDTGYLQLCCKDAQSQHLEEDELAPSLVCHSAQYHHQAHSPAQPNIHSHSIYNVIAGECKTTLYTSKR